jgi:hypothetical protein
LRAALSARQLDADRFIAKDNSTEPLRAWPALRALTAGIPHVPIPAQIELASEQVMLGGRPLQDIAAELHGDAKSWRVHKLEFRAPGRPGPLREVGSKTLRRSNSPPSISNRQTPRADDLAAGPRRYRLPQPETAAVARRRAVALRLCHRRHEGHTKAARWKGGWRCCAAGHRGSRSCGIGGAPRPRCRYRLCAVWQGRKAIAR